MPAAGHLRPALSWLLPLLAVAGLLALFAYASAPGLSGTGDSRYYLFAAQSWRASGRLLHPDGTPYRYWAPLYPLLLSATGAGAWLRALHAGCLTGALLLWTAVGRQLLPARRAAAVPLLLAVSTPALVLSRFVWAETGLALLWAGFVWALLRWLRTGRRRAFGLSVGLGLALPLQHNIGVFLLLGVGAGLQLAPPAAGAPGRGARLLHTALSLGGALLWQAYLLALPLPAHFYANLGGGQLLGSLADYGFVLLRWLLPLPAGMRAAGPAGGWALGLVAALALLWPRRPLADKTDKTAGKASSENEKEDTSGPPTGAPGPRLPPLPPLRWLWTAAAVFVLLLLPATVFRRAGAGVYDAERYAAVLYPVVVLLTLARWPAAGGALAQRFGPGAGRWLSRAALAAWLLYGGLRALHNAQQLRQLPPIAAGPGW